jgi:quercetin dioxygenase-like cupin family protein
MSNATIPGIATAVRARRLPLAITAGAVAAGCLVGVTAYAAVSQIIAVGTMEHSALVGGPATVTMRTLTIAPGEVLGWHYHPGSGAYTVVTAGTLSIEDGCGGETVYTAGQAFLEPPLRVHRGKNLTASPVVTAQTFIVPTGEPTSVATGQLCGAPIETHECGSGGWMAFNHPQSFANQGDCLHYVISNKLRQYGFN